MARHVIEIREVGTGGTGGGHQNTSAFGGDSPRKNRNKKKPNKFKDNMLQEIGRAVAVEASLSTVNDFVGKYTLNTLAARRRGMAISWGAIGMLSTTRPVIGTAIGVSLMVKSHIDYAIDINIRDIDADYLRGISGGTVNLSKREGMPL